jgi:uncharacterized membrane protein (Fun14 family)
MFILNLVTTVLAQNIIGPVTNPTKYGGTGGQGLFLFLGNVLKLVGTLAGIYMIVQLILAGYLYISANGDEKKTLQAWAQIWQSILGMIIIASAFVIASLVERFTGIKIISPVIYGP